jgi:hypothetical protein
MIFDLTQESELDIYIYREKIFNTSISDKSLSLSLSLMYTSIHPSIHTYIHTHRHIHTYIHLYIYTSIHLYIYTSIRRFKEREREMRTPTKKGGLSSRSSGHHHSKSFSSSSTYESSPRSTHLCFPYYLSRDILFDVQVSVRRRIQLRSKRNRGREISSQWVVWVGVHASKSQVVSDSVSLD